MCRRFSIFSLVVPRQTGAFSQSRAGNRVRDPFGGVKVQGEILGLDIQCFDGRTPSSQ
jgi:hypothetical protein